MGRSATIRDQKQEQLREQLWPGSGGRIWKSAQEKGYFCAPRVLPLLLRLMNDKGVVDGSSRGDCGTVYTELLSRDRGQGIVDMAGEGEHAYLSGYSGNRAPRTWKERVIALEKAGFIEIKSKPNQRVGTILIVHPHLVVSRLREEGKISHEWWESYIRLQREYGASLPEVVSAKKNLKLVRGANKVAEPSEDKQRVSKKK